MNVKVFLSKADLQTKGELLFAVYMAIAACFLTMKATYGFSPLDIGMYMSGYEWFNSDPESLSYLGQWQLTYQVTGWLCSLFGIETFFGLRVMRIVLLLGLQTIVWLYLRRRVSPFSLLLGLLLLTLSQYGAYSELNYNDWSVLWLVLAVLSYHKGLFRSRRAKLWIGLSGLAVGWAVMFRVVNLTFLLLPFAACVFTFRKADKPQWWRQLSAFFLGVAAGFVVVVLLSWLTGSLGVLQQTWIDVLSIGGDRSDTHGLNVIVRQYAYVLFYIGISVAVLTVIVKGAYAWGLNDFGLMVLVFGYSFLVYLFLDASVVGASCSLLPIVLHGKRMWQERHELHVLYAFSVLVLFILPLGSNAGIGFISPVMCVLSLPLALLMLDEWQYERDRSALRAVMWMYVVCGSCMIISHFLPQMEDGKLTQCDYAIENPKAAYIMTTKENADIHNKLLHWAGPQIPKGSYLVSNASLPLISLLECKPYGVFSDLYSSPKMSERYLQRTFAHTGGEKSLPYILASLSDMRPGFEYVMAWLRAHGHYKSTYIELELSIEEPVVEDAGSDKSKFLRDGTETRVYYLYRPE